MAIDRRPIQWANFAPRHLPHKPYTPYEYEPGNPRGYRTDYLSDPAAFLGMHLSSGTRVMSRMEHPTSKLEQGQFYGWGVPSSFYFNVPSDRREMLIDGIKAQKSANMDFTWGPYIGGLLGNPYVNSMESALHVCDLDDKDDRAAFEVSLMPYLREGVIYEVGLDALSRSQIFGDGLKLVADLEKFYGLHSIVEAYPSLLPSGGSWPDDLVWGNYATPMLALAQFIEPRDPNHQLSFDPDTTEVHVINQVYRAIDEEDYTDRGFIVGQQL